ncbi:MAG TPA: polyphenol oxidase family protein [Acidimicrobiales bacterium]|nr:polyphenol oxidase family protein [Acidimicrobiales bacterium]
MPGGPGGEAGTAVLTLPGTPVRVGWSGRADGDMGRPPGPDLLARALGLAYPPRLLRQVHGAGVVVAEDAPGAGEEPPEGDALVTAVAGLGLAVRVADCAPVALGSAEGACGAVHAGWRGVRAGILEGAVAAVRALGAGTVVAAVGPCARPCCYEFSPSDLDALVRTWGAAVVGRTRAGRPALDLAAAVGAVLGAVGVPVVADAGTCTVCSPRHYSYRGGDTTARQAMVVWREAAR